MINGTPSSAEPLSTSNYAVALECIVTSSDESLFLRSNREQLAAKLRSIDHIDDLLRRSPSAIPQIEESAKAFGSWTSKPLTWSLVLFQLESLYDERQTQIADEKEEEEEKEAAEDQEDQPPEEASPVPAAAGPQATEPAPGDTAEEEEAAEQEKEDDEGIAGEDRLRQLSTSLRRDFSYIDSILLAASRRLEANAYTHDLYREVTRIRATVAEYSERIKQFIKNISRLLGISGMFVAWQALMQRYQVVNKATRVAGTIMLPPILFAIFIVVPLYRLVRSPSRAVKWLADALDIDVPEAVAPEE